MIVVPKVLGKHPLKNRSLSGPCCKNRILMVLEINFQKVQKKLFWDPRFWIRVLKKGIFIIHVKFTDDPWKIQVLYFWYWRSKKRFFFFSKIHIYCFEYPWEKSFKIRKLKGPENILLKFGIWWNHP